MCNLGINCTKPSRYLLALPHTANEGPVKILYNVRFPLCIPRNETAFQNRIIIFCLPVPTLIYLWEIYIFPGLVCLFCCREKCGSILGIYKSLTDTQMWKLGLRLWNSQKRNTKIGFPLQCTFTISLLQIDTSKPNYLMTALSHSIGINAIWYRCN